MKRLLVAAGISASLIVAQTAAFADGTGSKDAPRVVDRVSAAVASPDGMVVPASADIPAPVVTTGTYNSLISQATTRSDLQQYLDGVDSYLGCYPFGCDTGGGGFGGLPLVLAGAVVVAALVAVSDDSDSD